MTHQASITTSFAQFLSSPLLGLDPGITEPLKKARSEVSSLGRDIPHSSQLVQGDVKVNTATMDNNQLQALFERINTYEPEVKKNLLKQLKEERPDFKPQIDAKQFLQHVAYGQQNEAESLLKSTLTQTQELLTAQNIPFTDYSGRTFNYTAYEYAYWTKDSHMQRMLERYMDNNTRAEILKRVKAIEELQGPGLFKELKGLTYTQNGVQHCSAHFDLTPLKKALNDWIKAYNKKPRAHPDELFRLWMQVGLAQREVPAHIAQEYCHPKRSFKTLLSNPDLLNASKPANLERGLLFFNNRTRSYDHWFTPISDGGGFALGTLFAILGGMSEDPEESNNYPESSDSCPGLGTAGTNLRAIEAIEKARTDDLKQALEQLASPSIPQAPAM